MRLQESHRLQQPRFPHALLPGHVARLVLFTAGLASLAVACGDMAEMSSEAALSTGPVYRQSVKKSFPDKMPGCTKEWKHKLKTVGKYMTATANSPSFEYCINRAVNFQKHLGTNQEFIFVGPYKECDGSIKDPERVLNGEVSAVDAIMSVARNNNNNSLHVECDSTVTQSSALVYNTDIHGFDHEKPEKLTLGYDALNEYSWFQHGWYDDGYKFDYADPEDKKLGFPLAPSYPVDELAGIILHERLHTHGFRHGTDNGTGRNGCGYVFDCRDTSVCYTIDGVTKCRGISGFSYQVGCRANSLLEIAEACMSEVVEESTVRCWSSTCPKDELPIYDVHPDGGGCHCRSHRPR